MKRIFGKGNRKEPLLYLSDVIKRVDGRADSIETKISKLDAELLKLKDHMVKMREGPAKNSVKQRALRILKQKKMYESQVNSLQQQAFNMEQINFATLSLKDTQATVTAMEAGLKTMQKEFKKLSIDEIEDLQDEMVDMLDMHEEVQEALGRTYGVPEIDDLDLEIDLYELGDEIALDNDPSYLDEIKAPVAPNKEPGTESLRDKDGVVVDEFGLPHIPAQ